LTQRSRVFGGPDLTTTDIAVAAGLANLGQADKVADLPAGQVALARQAIQAMVETAIDRVKTSAEPVPVVLVGGGSILVGDTLQGAAEVIRPAHFAVANAVGAAIAQVGGEIDQVFALAQLGRDVALEQARREAIQRAVQAGAKASTVQVVEMEEIPMAYLPGNATRIRVKAVGDLALESK